ncbi:MAG TPA: hypothetical protein VIX37_14195 [Candidatus Sulfotelmatobacter sp.]
MTTITATPPKIVRPFLFLKTAATTAPFMGSLSGTLYLGVSGNLHRRVFQHKCHHFEGFTDRYNVIRPLYWESLRRRSQGPRP